MPCMAPKMEVTTPQSAPPWKDWGEVVTQTVKGASAMLLENGSHPETEIDKVTTAGGVTIRGLNAMEHGGFTSAVIRGLTEGEK